MTAKVMGYPVFTANDGETGADAALTIIWGALEYFEDQGNDVNLWSLGEALLHSLEAAGLVNITEEQSR